MSVFGPKQVEELILGNAVAAEATVDTFIASAPEKSINAVAADGGVAESGKKFYLLQKTSGDALKGLNYEFSDIVDPKKVDKVILKTYKPEVQKEVTISGFDNIIANTLYAVNVRLYNESGSLSTENFRVISGYYQTGPSVTGVTADTIRDGVKKTLELELESRGGNEFVVTAGAGTLVIAGKYQDNKHPGKDVGAQIQFDVTTKVLERGNDYNLGLLIATTTQNAYPGNGTGKYAKNLEWFTKGYKYSPLRDMDPLGFDSPMYANPAGMYNAVHIKYFSSRTSPGLETQDKVLTILVEKAADDLASNAETNELLARLRAFGVANVPADLAVL